MQGRYNIQLCHLNQKVLNEAIEQYRSDIDHLSIFSFRLFEQHNVKNMLSLLGREDFENNLLDLKLNVNHTIKIYNLEIDERLVEVLDRKTVDVFFSFSTLYTEQKMIFCEPLNLWTDFFKRIFLNRNSFTGMDLAKDILEANKIVDKDDLLRKMKVVITKLLLMQYLYIESSGDTENQIE